MADDDDDEYEEWIASDIDHATRRGIRDGVMRKPFNPPRNPDPVYRQEYLRKRRSGRDRRDVPVHATFAQPGAEASCTYAPNSQVDSSAASYLRKDGTSPNAVLHCVIQTGDGDNADFLDGYVGTFRSGKFLRFVMQNDERDDDGTYGWHSWDVPWSRLVEVILRDRSTPQVLTDARQPDGTYARKGPYLQTRLYTMGRGIECRLLDADYRKMHKGEPFRWLRSNVNDGDARFSEDTQEEPQYGDAPDCLDGYPIVECLRFVL